MVSKIKRKIEKGLCSVGSWMQISSSDIAEILGCSGYDWIAVDLEHGNFSNEKLPEIFRAIEIGGTVPLARIATTKTKDIKDALEAGAQGLIFPMIETASQLKKAISDTFYPPKGSRGVGYSRVNLFGKKFDDYLNTTAKGIFVVAQIEHINAVENLDEILSVPGLDSIMIGPYDLSGSMGITGEFENPQFINIVDKIFKKANKKKIPMGFHVVHPDKFLLEEKINEGYQFLAYCTDAVFLFSSSDNPIK